MIIYTNTASKKKKHKKSQELFAAEKKHAEFLKCVGYTGKAKQKKLPVELANQSEIVRIPTSDKIPMGVVCSKKSIDDWKWKKNIEETNATILEIERKKKRIAILFNKGAYQYITDDNNSLTLGKK